MKAMILAAGRGTRMGALTTTKPKPLLPVWGKPLIAWHLEALARAGITQVIINLAYLGRQISQYVGDGSAWDLQVSYSTEPEPLETGGAIFYARTLLGSETFLLINADVFCDMDLSVLINRGLKPGELGHLLLVPNPGFKPRGDFSLTTRGQVQLPRASIPAYTFAGISLLNPALVVDYPHCREQFPLLEALQHAIKQDSLSGQIYKGLWSDIGTPERLREIDQALTH
ncbi:MAG TPA: nucleotidyltransferase family protein [Cellvibrionaceae bacterium]